MDISATFFEISSYTAVLSWQPRTIVNLDDHSLRICDYRCRRAHTSSGVEWHQEREH